MPENNLERDMRAALCAVTEGALEDGVDALRGVVAKYPTEIVPLGHLAYHLLRLNRSAEAVPCYERILALDPDCAEARSKLGDCYAILGNRKSAYRLYRSLWKNPLLTRAEWEARIYATEPRWRFPIRKNFFRLPLLARKVFSPGYANALWKEVVSLPDSLKGIAASGAGAYLEYLRQRYSESDYFKVPIAPCDLCGKNDFEATFFYQHNKIVRCRECGLQFVERRPPEGFDFERSFFEMPETIDYFESNFWENPEVLAHTMDLLLDTFQEFGRLVDKRGARLLEIGCAQGRYLHYLRDKGFVVAGLEPSRALADYAREKFGLEVACGTVGAWIPEEEAYDGVLAYHVLEHLDRPSLLFEKAWKSLAPGGLLVIETPVPDLYDRPLPDQLDTSSGFGCLGHMYFFTKDSVELYLEKYEFELLRTYEYPTPLPHGGFLARKKILNPPL